MSDASDKTPDLSAESLHFQLLLFVTVVFLVAFFWFTAVPHTNTREAQLAAAADATVMGLQIIGSYLAFVSVLLGHKLLRRRR